MTRMTPALARLLVDQRDKERPKRAPERQQREQTRTAQVKVPQQRTGVRLPPR